MIHCVLHDAGDTVAVSVTVRGGIIKAEADGVRLAAEDQAFADGAIGLLVHEGALSTLSIRVGPAQ